MNETLYGRYRAEVEVAGEPDRWHTNALRFETETDARAYANDLAGRWMLVTRYRVAELVDGEWAPLGEPVAL